jgi:hypothetical protein
VRARRRPAAPAPATGTVARACLCHVPNTSCPGSPRAPCAMCHVPYAMACAPAPPPASRPSAPCAPAATTSRPPRRPPVPAPAQRRPAHLPPQSRPPWSCGRQTERSQVQARAPARCCSGGRAARRPSPLALSGQGRRGARPSPSLSCCLRARGLRPLAGCTPRPASPRLCAVCLRSTTLRTAPKGCRSQRAHACMHCAICTSIALARPEGLAIPTSRA